MTNAIAYAIRKVSLPNIKKMTTIDKNKFARAIKKYREENDLTQNELAQKLGTAITTVARWELGLSVPKQQTLIRQIKELGISW